MAKRKKASSTAIAKWDEQLAQYAEASAAMEAKTGGGQFFSLRGGQLTWQDNPIQGNSMAVIILDTVMENIYYEGRFDPEVISPPTCFAFGRSEDEMQPHESVVELDQAVNEQCSGCPMNEWGSANIGKGKACRNTRRLALLSAGTLDGDDVELYEDEHFQTSEVGYMKLPVTSVKGYGSFVKQVATTLRRPPFGIITRLSVVPDDKTQFRVVFEALDKVPDSLMNIVMDRHTAIENEIMFPYTLEQEEQEKPKSRKKAPTRKRAKKY